MSECLKDQQSICVSTCKRKLHALMRHAHMFEEQLDEYKQHEQGCNADQCHTCKIYRTQLGIISAEIKKNAVMLNFLT